MPNIIINNYCNQKCSYCFANANMKDKKLQKDMSISTYLNILKFLNKSNDKNVRILGWEPILSPNIRKFLLLAYKWWFNIIVFSNINIDHEKIKTIFSWLEWIRINCNINDKDFYNKNEIININQNIEILNNLWIKIIIWYNITDIEKFPSLTFNLAEKYNISAINIKITNSTLDWRLLINNSSRELWIYIFNIIIKYHKKYFLEFSCWLDKSIFLAEELGYINNKTNIKLKFGCDWNIWKFDINTDWTIFKCYPLEQIFKDKIYSFINIKNILDNNIHTESIIKTLSKWLISDWECTANKIIKSKI